MPIPQVNDRIKEAPVVLLRAVFAGIGQLLLTADKVRSRAAEQVWIPERATAPGPVGQTRPYPVPQEPRNGTVHTQPAVTERPVVREAAASSAKTAAAPRAAKATPAAKTPPAAKTTSAAETAEAAPPARKGPAAKAKTGTAPRTTKARPAAEAPPLPGYDDLSLASLRARLRTLDAPAIRAMLAYERAHARREPVMTMLERRLAKISAG